MKSLKEVFIDNGMYSLNIMNDVFTPDGKNGSQGDRLIKSIKEYTEQFIDTASELADSKYPAQNKESILKLKKLIK